MRESKINLSLIEHQHQSKEESLANIDLLVVDDCGNLLGALAVNSSAKGDAGAEDLLLSRLPCHALGVKLLAMSTISANLKLPLFFTFFCFFLSQGPSFKALMMRGAAVRRTLIKHYLF